MWLAVIPAQNSARSKDCNSAVTAAGSDCVGEGIFLSHMQLIILCCCRGCSWVCFHFPVLGAAGKPRSSVTYGDEVFYSWAIIPALCYFYTSKTTYSEKSYLSTSPWIHFSSNYRAKRVTGHTPCLWLIPQCGAPESAGSTDRLPGGRSLMTILLPIADYSFPNGPSCSATACVHPLPGLSHSTGSPSSQPVPTANSRQATTERTWVPQLSGQEHR